MKTLLRKYIIITSIIYFLTLLIPSFNVGTSLISFLLDTFLLTIFFYILRPIVNIVLFPINFLTLGFSAWIINIVTFMIWVILLSDVDIGSWTIPNLSTTSISISETTLGSFVTALIISILVTFGVQLLDGLFGE